MDAPVEAASSMSLDGVHDRRATIVKLPSGRRLGIAEFGAPDGMPVIACHGAPASRLMFEVADAEAARLGLRLIAFDRPGYGLSPLDYGATLHSRTEVFAELPDVLGLGRFALVGISGGAPYAVALAARLTHRVNGLALLSPLGPVGGVQETERREVGGHLSIAHRSFFLSLPAHPWLLRANAEVAMRAFRAAPHTFASLFSHLLPEEDRRIVGRPEVAASIVDMTMEATRTGISGGVADLEIYAEPWHIDLKAVTAPSQLWQGLADLIVPVEVSLRLARELPRCGMHKIEGAGHFWIYEHIAEVLYAVREMMLAAPEEVPPSA